MSIPYSFFLVRHALRSVWKTTARRGLRLVLAPAPAQKRIAVERWLRGREEVRELRAADVVVVSFGKAGRTWLRVMLSRVYQQKHGLPQNSLLGFDNFHHMNPEVARISFTHDNYIKDYTGHRDSKADFYDKKVVLLVRDPRDVAVSQFFQWKFRMTPAKTRLLRFPEQGADVPVVEFMLDPNAGLPRSVAFMNLWAREAARIKELLLIRYEDLRARPEATLKALMDFMGTPATDAQIREAVEFASFENMKKLEKKKVFWFSGGRMVPGDRGNPDSYKVRRAKVGGYRDYLENAEIARVDTFVEANLTDFFGYAGKSAKDGASAAGGARASAASV